MAISETGREIVGYLRIVRYTPPENGKPVHVQFVVVDSSDNEIEIEFDTIKEAAAKLVEIHEPEVAAVRVGGLKIVRATTENGKPVRVRFVVVDSNGNEIEIVEFDTIEEVIAKLAVIYESEIVVGIVGSVDGLKIVLRATTENGKPVHIRFAVVNSGGTEIGEFGTIGEACEFAERILHERTLQKPRSSPQGSSTPGTDPGMGM